MSIKTFVMCRAKSYHLLKYSFGICLCSISNYLSKVSNLFQNGHIPIFAYFGGHSSYHSSLRFDYCSNIIIKKILVKRIFIYFLASKGAKIAP